MGLFFGTDGLRGEFGKTITAELAFRCGNALAVQKKDCKIILGVDTRLSGDLLALSFATGAISAGASVTFAGMLATAGVSFLTKLHGFDYGVVISASHNPAEFNGIKIFKSDGTKLGEYHEKQIEKNLLNIKATSHENLGGFKFDKSLALDYEEFLIKTAKSELKKNYDFSGLKIVLDCANGTASFIAPKVFEALGAKVICISNEPNGTNINQNSGALHIENLQKQVLEAGADMGFAFDGDSDRVLAACKNGRVVDGDELVYIFAKYYNELGRLKGGTVVGTKHTNMGIEKALLKIGINLIRTDIGDKYVSEALETNGLVVGGEQSGHIFLRDKLQTGDGILNALMLTCVCVNKNKSLSELCDAKKYHQTNLNTKVKNKENILKNTELKSAIKSADEKLSGRGRVMVRASGTEPVIRTMAECEDEIIADFIANELEKMIRKIDSRGGLCVE